MSDCAERRKNCGVRYPARNMCVGIKHCECWDGIKGCLGIIQIRESFRLTPPDQT